MTCGSVIRRKRAAYSVYIYIYVNVYIYIHIYIYIQSITSQACGKSAITRSDLPRVQVLLAVPNSSHLGAGR